MKKVFLILVLLSIHISTCFAQDWYEVVYLKDGSIIKGLIVKQKPNAYIRIQDLEGNITIIDYLQILLICILFHIIFYLNIFPPLCKYLF